MSLRPYQQRVVSEIEALWRNDVDRAICVLPTGGGKTVVGSHLAQPFKNPLSICHTRTLADQLNARLCQAATWQSLRRSGRWPNGQPDLLVVDEVHVGDSPDWQKVFDMVQPGTKVLGLTATPWRFSHGARKGARKGAAEHLGATKNDRFGKGLGDLFGAMVVGVTPLELVRDGYLVPLRVLNLVEAQDAEARRNGKRGPSWSSVLGRETGRVTSNSDQRLDIFDAWARHAEDRKTMVFCHLVPAAERACAKFVSAGIAATFVHGKVGAKECEKRLDAFKSGQVKVLINVMQLTCGVDVPDVACIMIDRGANSLNTYIQICGRGARTAEGKTDCLVLDLTGCSAEHGHPQKDQDYWVCTSEGRPVSELACDVCGTRLSPMFPTRCMRCDPFRPKLGDPKALLDTGMRVYSLLKDLGNVADETIVETLKGFKAETETEGAVLVAEVARAAQRIDRRIALAKAEQAKLAANERARVALAAFEEKRAAAKAEWQARLEANQKANEAWKLEQDRRRDLGKARKAAPVTPVAQLEPPTADEMRIMKRTVWASFLTVVSRNWGLAPAVRDVRDSLPRYAGKFEREDYTIPPELFCALVDVRRVWLDKRQQCLAKYEFDRMMADQRTSKYGAAWVRKKVRALFGPVEGYC